MSESAKTAGKSAAKTVSVTRQQRLMQVLVGPAVSEKSTMVGDKHNQVVFRVERSATKVDVKAAVELMFKVEVDGVQVLNVKGKEKRHGRFIGRRNAWKKAYVRLKPGQEINFAEGEGR
jgi:large subunit ribosomal protein L23